MRPVALLLALFAVSGCGGSGAPADRPERDGGNVVLYVSNQSFERERVDIRIEVDGDQVVSDEFAVEDQHTWVEYRLALAPGGHTLAVTSSSGDATLERRFTVRDRLWAVVDYWCCDDGARFTFDVSRRPIAFA